MSGSPDLRIDLAFESELQLGRMRVRPALLEVVIDDDRQVLEPRVMQVLVALARRPGEVVTRDQLVKQCWESRAVSDDSINRTISKIRALCRDASGEPVFRLETVARVGYRLFPGRASASAESLPATALTIADITRTARRLITTPVRLAAASAVVALVTTAALTNERAGALAAKPEGVALAVLPFADLSADQSCKYFGRGVAEEIAVMLAADPELNVKTGGAAPDSDYAKLARERDVSYVLDGSVRRKDRAVRVTVRLVNARTGVQIWATDYDRGLADVWATQRDIGSEVARNILSRDSPADLRPTHRTDGETYRLYLTAVGMLRTGEPERLPSAQKLLRQVLKRDPDYLPGRVWLNIAETASKRQLNQRVTTPS